MWGARANSLDFDVFQRNLHFHAVLSTGLFCRPIDSELSNQYNQDMGFDSDTKRHVTDLSSPSGHAGIAHLLNAAIRSGKIRRAPCEVCGKNPTEGHHFDYSRPFEVIWLCRKHHREIHSKAGSYAAVRCHWGCGELVALCNFSSHDCGRKTPPVFFELKTQGGKRPGAGRPRELAAVTCPRCGASVAASQIQKHVKACKGESQ